MAGIDFKKLKSQRGSTLSKLTEKLETMNKGGGAQKDERIYKPGFDKKEGKGYAVVRFIPNEHGEPFVRVFSHMFNANGSWYVENSRSTIGEEDPVGISNGLYWKKSEVEGNKTYENVARSRKRNTKYYANVLVIKDTVNPDNNGKVMIYEFGAQIFKMIEGAAKPEFDDTDPMDPFDMWTGADFKIKIVGREMPDTRTGKTIVVPNYEKSEFDKVSELFDGDDEKKEEVFKKAYDLSEFAKVKPFKELAERFLKVTGEAHDALIGGHPADSVAKRLEEKIDLDQQQEAPRQQKSADPEPQKTDGSEGDGDDDDILKMFRELAES